MLHSRNRDGTGARRPEVVRVVSIGDEHPPRPWVLESEPGRPVLNVSLIVAVDGGRDGRASDRYLGQLLIVVAAVRRQHNLKPNGSWSRCAVA
jgi:hypothetical protein